LKSEKRKRGDLICIKRGPHIGNPVLDKQAQSDVCPYVQTITVELTDLWL